MLFLSFVKVYDTLVHLLLELYFFIGIVALPVLYY